MKWFKMKEFTMLAFIFVLSVEASDPDKIRRELSEFNKQIESLKTAHEESMKALRQEMDELKSQLKARCTHEIRHHGSITEERNDHQTLDWARKAVHELRVEMKELARNVNGSTMLHQLHTLHNQMKQVLSETADLLNLGRTQEARLDKMDGQVERLKYEKQQIQKLMEELRRQLSQLAKEVRHKILAEEEAANDMLNPESGRADEGPLLSEKHHKYRHNKMIHAQISRLAHAQDQLDAAEQSIQTQMLDHQRRLDRLEEPNWNLISAKIDLLELQAKVFSDRLNNNTRAVSDFEKVHASLLELREDLEGVENKIDKTIPEFRKEISKLDVSQAQMTAHFSYVKEDQENLRQSVKAIAVSVSNALDRADRDREELQQISTTVSHLQARTKEHYYRLNDHILKSEANRIVPETNLTETISLPELMGEVKELQPVQREYEDLVNQLPKDCSSISGPAGTYFIHPGHSPLDAWCQNGTTLIQRRYNGTVEFNRKFAEYAHGFGDPTSEYWLGLDTMHLLTADNCTGMQIDMTDIYGAFWFAQYDHFSVGSADSGYVLDVSGFKGNASDAFEYQNHMEFSAIDRDRDISNTHCASNYEGGWWFSHCQHVNINGKYTLGLTWFDSARNEWIAVATSEMRIFRHPGCV